MNLKKMLSLMLACILCVALSGCDSEQSLQNDANSESEVEQQAEKIFVDDENCTFKISGTEVDDIWGYTLKVDLENKTDKNLMFSLNDVSVNGYMCDPFWATTVQGGKKAKSDISFSLEQLEEFGIEEVEEIEFTLSVYDDDNWSAPHMVEETFTYVVNE